MTQLLDDLELILSDLAQSGFSTGSESCARRFRELAEQFSAAGLHTAAVIVSEISEILSLRPHQTEKNDAVLMEHICTAVRYVELAREKLMQQSILDRWDEALQCRQGGRQ